MPNADLSSPLTLPEMVKGVVDRVAALEADVQERDAAILLLQKENMALRTALRALGAEPPTPEPTKGA